MIEEVEKKNLEDKDPTVLRIENLVGNSEKVIAPEVKYFFISSFFVSKSIDIELYGGGKKFTNHFKTTGTKQYIQLKKKLNDIYFYNNIDKYIEFDAKDSNSPSDTRQKKNEEVIKKIVPTIDAEIIKAERLDLFKMRCRPEKFDDIKSIRIWAYKDTKRNTIYISLLDPHHIVHVTEKNNEIKKSHKSSEKHFDGVCITEMIEL